MLMPGDICPHLHRRRRSPLMSGLLIADTPINSRMASTQKAIGLNNARTKVATQCKERNLRREVEG